MDRRLRRQAQPCYQLGVNLRAPTRPILRALPLVCWGLLSACHLKDNEELPVWTPQDHDNQEKPAPGQVDTSAPRPGMPDLAEHGINDVILATWKQNCTPCHGLIGKGDGPQGRALNPPDLTNPAFHRTAIDSELGYAIKKGRGRMPAFGHLPDATITGLVRLVRMLNAEPAAPPSAPEDQPGAPERTASAEPASPPPPHPPLKSPAAPQPAANSPAQ